MAGLTSLTGLYLANTSVTDAGIQYLSSLKKLTELDLSYCRTSDAAEEELRHQIPGLFIVHDVDYSSYESDVESEAGLSD